MNTATQAQKQVALGRFTGVFGIRGWLKVWSWTDPPENFLNHKEFLYRGRDDRWRSLRIDQGNRRGRGLVVHVAGCDDRDEARQYLGTEVAVPAGQLPALPEGEFYWHQLIGLEVWSTVGEKSLLLGRVDHMVETGANDVLAVLPTAGSCDERRRLIPWVLGDTVRKVEQAQGRIQVDWDLQS